MSPKKPAKRTLGWWLRRGLLVLLQGVVLALLATIALIGGWIQSADFERRAIDVAEALIERQTGEECTIDGLDVRFWPPALEVHGFYLHNALTGDVIVRADHGRAPLVLRDGGIRLGRVRIDEPFVWLHLDEKGKLAEFQRMRRPAEGAPRNPLRQLPWNSLEITGGAFRLTYPWGQLDLDAIELAPTQGPIADLDADLHVVARGLEDRAHLRIEGIALGPDTIDVPPFELRTRPLVVTGEGRYRLGGDFDVDLHLAVPLEEINPILTEPRKAHGQVYADIRLEGSPDDPTVRVTALAQQLGLDLPGVFTPLLTYEFGDLSASAIARKDGIVLENLTASIASGQITAWGEITPDKRLRNGRVVGDHVSLRELLMDFDAAPTPWIDMSSDLEIAWDGTLQPLRLEGHFDLDVARLRVTDRPISDPEGRSMLDIPAAWAKGTLLLEKDHIFLAANTVQGPRSRGSCTVDIGFGPRGPLDLQIDMSRADLRDFQPLRGVELTGRGRIVGKIQGPFNKLQMRGQGDVTDFSVLGIPYADHLVATLVSPDMKSIELHGARARRGVTDYGGWFRFDFRPPMAMDTDIEFDHGRIEDVTGMFIDLPGMTGDLSGTLSLHGPLYDMDGEAHLSLSDVDLWGEKFEYGEGHGYMDKGLFTLDDLRVQRHGGKEGLLLRGEVGRKWALNMDLHGDGLAIERMTTLADADLPLTGKISVQSHITNTLFDPNPDGRIAVTDVRFNGYPAEDSHLVFESRDGVAHFGAVILGGAATADGTQGLWKEQPYHVAIDLTDLPVHLLYPEDPSGAPIRATTSGQVTVDGHFGEQWSPVTLRAALDDVEVRYNAHVLKNTSTWHYAQDGKSYRLEDFSLTGGDTSFQLSATGGQTLLLGGEGVVDLDLLRTVVPGLERARGTAAVKLFATGSAPNVETVVDVDVSAEILRHSSVPASFEDLSAHAQLTRDRFEITDLFANLGGGTISGGGSVEADHWLPKRYDLSATVRDAQIQWVDALPPAIGNAELSFDGPVGAVLMSGDVDITDMTFSDRIDWEDWVVEYRDEMLVNPATAYENGEEAWFAFNVKIDADRTIRMRNNIGEGTASADLRLIGDTARPGLLGRVTVDNGVAFIQEREFVIDRGDVMFNDPWTWDPQIDFDLVTDIENRDQRYRVSYHVFGPFSDWRTDTRSDPPLAQADVNALLWFGLTTEQLEEMGELSSAVFQGVADFVLTDFFLTSAQVGEISSSAQDLLFNTHLDLATGVNARGEYSSEPRLVVRNRIDALGAVDVTVEVNIVRPDDNYVSVEKRLGAGAWSLAGWYATQQRDRVLPIGGAYGIDVKWRSESD